MPVEQDSDRLLDLLNAEGVHPAVLQEQVRQFSDEVKNAVAARVEQMPTPPGRLLARLSVIRTDQNTPTLVRIYVANLRSPDPEARKFSLYELDTLGHPDLETFARDALRDTDDQVLFAASTILLRRMTRMNATREASRDAAAAVAPMLRDLCGRLKGKKEFHATVSLLEAHGLC